MRVFRSLDNLPAFKNTVITIGSFDGVHKGHQQILKKVNLLAKNSGGESVVITFYPHPRSIVYSKDKPIQLLNTIEEKIALFEKYGIDNVVVVPFTVEFSQIQPDEYIENFLIKNFNPKYIVVGYDHRFGVGRQGNINYLMWYCEKYGYEVIEIDKQVLNEVDISSTKIRKAIEKGNVSYASKLLGHYYTISGSVIHGEKIGRNIGYPTANIKLTQNDKLIPPIGIYAANVIVEDKRYGGMLYIGTRPTITESGKISIEVNIFDFSKEIYGDAITVELVEYIRGDATFSSLDELKFQLKKDEEDSLIILKREKNRFEKKVDKYPSVAVVILNYNTKEQLEKFLPSVLATNYPNFSVIVADNGSRDGSLGFVQKHFPEVERINFSKNYGFAVGYNLALEQTGADYAVLLNSDVEVTPDWISPIVELMEKDSTIGAVQPKIKSYQFREQFEYAGASGGFLDNMCYPLARGRVFDVVENDTGQYDDSCEIFWASGAAMFIRPEIFRKAGGFDGEYFAHWEEIDLCWRLKRAGYKIMVEPKSVVYHVGGGTLNYQSPKKTYLNFRNNHKTFFKNESWSKLLWLMPLRLIFDGISGFLFLSEGKFGHLFSIVKAHFYLYFNLPKAIKKRNYYNREIESIRIADTPNLIGMVKKNAVWQFFIKGKKTFMEIFSDEK